MTGKTRGLTTIRVALTALIAAFTAMSPQKAFADEGGVSFWVPGFFGSLAATP
jgi:hypothetical protein